MMLTRKSVLCVAALIGFLIPQATQASLLGTSFDVTLNAFVETPPFPPFGIEGHNSTGQTFDGLAETLPSSLNVLGAQGNDLTVTDVVTVTGPMAESVVICIENPTGAPLFNGDLNTGFGPQFTIFNVTNMSWGAGAGPATVSNVELSFVDIVGSTTVVPFAPTVVGDGTTAPLGFISIIPNADLENGMQKMALSFDVSHPVPEPSVLLGLLIALPALLRLRRS